MGHPSANLRPLEPDMHGTGRWNFSGKNLAPEEVEALTRKGVDWIEDIMPDGRLKHPKHRLRHNAETVFTKSITDRELADRDVARREEYAALPEPKPDYFEWRATKDRMEHYRELERIALQSKRPSERLKALGTLLEFSKAKPKQQIELNQQRDIEPISPDKLLALALELNGYEPGKALSALQKTTN